MAYSPPLNPRRVLPLGLAATGAVALAGGVALGPTAALGGSVVFAGALALALQGASVPVLTWRNGLVLFLAVVWFVPIKLYRLPVALPFNLELYRLFLVVLVFALFVSVLLHRGSFAALGHGKALLLLAGVAVASQVANVGGIEAGGANSQALKSLSYFLSFSLVFLVVASAVRSPEEIDTLVKALVLGGAVVAVFALVEGQTRLNPFDHLDRWIPFLDRQPREVLELRGGRLRVHASAQHPIALGAALVMMVPLAVYLASRAASAAGRRAWGLAVLVLLAGAFATVSRTVILMVIVMAIFAVWLRRGLIVRHWPVVLALAVLVHVASPGAIGGLYKSFFQEDRGLTTSLYGRAGLPGSGRLADLRPGITLWSQSPLVGHGLGSLATTGQSVVLTGPATNQPALVFDDQYLNTLVTLGALGLAATIWVVWGGVAKLVRPARRVHGPPGDLLAACAVAGAGFAGGMLTFDAFSFVQCTLLFFVVLAIGLRVRNPAR